MAGEIKKVMFSVRMSGENIPPIRIPAWTTSVAGLVVHPMRRVVRRHGTQRIVASRNSWAISLYPIGLKVIGEIPTREQAEHIIVTKFAKYQWVGLVVDDIRNTNDMDELGKTAQEVRRYVANLRTLPKSKRHVHPLFQDLK